MKSFFPRKTITVRRVLPSHFRFRPRLIVITREDIENLIERLRGNGWLTGAALGAKSGWEKRKLKAIVDVAAGAILHFRGSPGFKLIEEATKAELRRGIAMLRNEARQPLRLALGYRRHLLARITPGVNLEFRFQQPTTTQEQ